MTPTAIAIGERVRALRKERRWTQAELARLLGITQGHLSQLERGRGSFLAEHLVLIIRHFNSTIDAFITEKAPAEVQIHKALAREGAAHLIEDDSVLPSDKLKNAYSAIREALVSGESNRQLAAIAPVIVNHVGQLNFTKLQDDFAKLGLGSRLSWAIEATLEAVKAESSQVLPREWRIKYRRAQTVIEYYLAPFALTRSTENPDKPEPFDFIDPSISTSQTLKEVTENLSPLARKWKIATRLEVDDFARALREARDAN